jgi:uncharacterized protein YecE (DUF72 family)
MKLYAGTSGYSYKEWKGSFYPEDLPDKEMLHYYGEQLPAVEINNTFYRLPKASMLENWAQQVPDDFQFILKASRKITHFKKLKETDDETGYLIKTAGSLQNRLGVILFQLPPYLRKDIDLLNSFLDLLPDTVRSAFEFRHRSWFEEDVFEALHLKNCALCVADTDDDKLEVPFVSTADWGYLRLRRQNYDDDSLSDWMERIEAQDWQKTYVFFKHEDEGAGPKMARHFLDLFRET